MNPFRGDPGLTFAGVLLLAALGAGYWKSAPLESARPAEDVVIEYDARLSEGVAARLWQDPFKAVFTQCPSLRSQPAQGSESPAAGTDSCGIQSVETVLSSLSSLGKGERVLILPTMIWPGSHVEVEERRRRIRYAVLSALIEFGYAPRDPERLGVLTTGCNGDEVLPVPYEWFDRQTSKPSKTPTGLTADSSPVSVLVLWLDDARVGQQPFLSLFSLLRKAPPEHSRLAVIGPARSNTLRNMVGERTSPSLAALKQHFSDGGATIRILSPHATVSDREIIQDTQLDSLLVSLEEAFVTADPQGLGPGNVEFLRTIRDDQSLIEALVADLRRRGVAIPPVSYEGNVGTDEQRDHIVVISEWDTYYGRALPKALAEALCSKPDCDQLHRYSYQRGIDGFIPGQKRREVSVKPGAKASQDPLGVLANGHQVRRAVGTGQYDYLRRLAEEIRALDRRLHLEEGRSIRAVFVLGSDVYDKLLILRALRGYLPGAVWMTTDYDALLFHPADFRWTRNLVIASTFGGHMAESLQTATAPFRDAYQASTYLATAMALGPEALTRANIDIPADGSIQPWLNRSLPVQLFEVGREGPVVLSTHGDREAGAAEALNVAPTQDDLSAEASVIALLIIAVIALFALHQLRPESGVLLAWLTVVLVLMAMLTGLALKGVTTGEPLSFSDGVSIWPTEYIRLGIVILAVYFIWLAVRQLDDNALQIDTDYFGGGEVERRRGKTLRQVYRESRRWLDAPRRLWGLVWVRHLLLAALVIIAVPVGLRWVQLPVALKLGFLAVFWIAVIGFWWSRIYGRTLRIRSVNAWACEAEQCKEVGKLWAGYRQMGGVKDWFLRSTSYILVYMAFATVVFTVLGNTPSPCRGAACAVDRALLGFSILGTLFLLFVVVDAIRLCLCWIERTGGRDVQWNELQVANGTLRLPGDHEQMLYKVQLIGDRTTAVSRLVYYPVLLILLMLLARSTYFDDWGFPQALAIVVGGNFLIALASALKLNQVAEKVRNQIVERLKKEQLHLVATKDGGAPEPVKTVDEVTRVIDRIQGMEVGAFRKLWDQPIVRATLLLLGGIGITYSEYTAFF